MHLYYLGPLRVFLHPEFPSGRTGGWGLASCSVWGLDGGQHSLFTRVTGSVLCPHFGSYHLIELWHKLQQSQRPDLCSVDIKVSCLGNTTQPFRVQDHRVIAEQGVVFLCLTLTFLVPASRVVPCRRQQSPDSRFPLGGWELLGFSASLSSWA